MSSEDTTESDGSNPVMGVVRTVTPDFVRKRFALKFVIVLLMMGIAIMALGAYGTAQITSETEDRIQNEYSGLAVQEQNVVEEWLEQNRVSTRLISGEGDTWTGDDSVAISEAARNRQANTDASSVYIFEGLNASSEVVGGTQSQPGTRMAELPQRWALNREYDSDSQVHVSTVYMANGEPMIGFASRVPDSDRYVLVEASVREIADLFQGQERASGGFTVVANESGTVLIDERSENATAETDMTLTEYGSGTALRPVNRAGELSQEPSGVINEMPANDGIIDEPYTVGYAPVIVSNGPADDWVVLVHAPRTAIFGFAQTVQTFGLLTTGAAALLIVLIGAVLGYNTSTSINRLTRKAEEMEEGNLDVDIHSQRIDAIGRLYDGFAEMRDALHEQIQEAEQARKEAEVSRAEAMEMNNYLQEKAEEYSETMQACSRGDLTRRMEPEGENDAMDQIAEDFNDMIAELEMTTGQLKTFAVEVEEGGRGVQQSAETVRDASEQVADSVQKISDDAYDQKERLQEISEEMDAIAAQLEDFADQHPDVDFGDSLETIHQIAEMIGQAVELGEETMAESENVAGAAEEQAAELNEVSSRAEELVRYAQYLGDGLSNFETEEEHEFVFQTGAGSTGPAGDEVAEPDAGEGGDAGGGSDTSDE